MRRREKLGPSARNAANQCAGENPAKASSGAAPCSPIAEGQSRYRRADNIDWIDVIDNRVNLVSQVNRPHRALQMDIQLTSSVLQARPQHALRSRMTSRVLISAKSASRQWLCPPCSSLRKPPPTTSCACRRERCSPEGIPMLRPHLVPFVAIFLPTR